jgi:hypothetical protein
MVLALPRALVLEHLERVAASALDLTDEWEYRRRLELAELLDVELVRVGLASNDPDLREAAEDWQARLA